MSIGEKIYNNTIKPITLFRKEYTPIIILYLAYGLSGFITIALTFWMKNELSLSTSDIVQIAFWAHMPWTCKIVFSQFIDNLSILTSRRKSYIYLGAICMTIGHIIFAATVYKILILSIYSQIVLSSILISAGIVIQDLVADTLCLEIVICEKKERNLSEEEYKYTLGIVQLLGRLSLMFGMIIAALIGGILAEHLHMRVICLGSFLIPIFSISSTFFLHEAKHLWSQNHIDKKLALLIIAMIISSIAASILNTDYKSELNFTINLIFTLIMISYILKNKSVKHTRELIGLGLIIFFFRANPSFGPGAEWWQIDVLKFNPQFFSVLSQTGIFLGFFTTLVFSSYILRKDIKKVLIAIVILSSSLKLPVIGMAYGLHEWTKLHFGFGAKTIAIINVVSEDPFNALAMIPLLALAAFYAPATNKVTWFALIANFMNLALSGGTLITKYLQKLFEIKRGEYNNIGDLMISCTILDVVLPISAIFLVTLWQKQDKKIKRKI